MLFVALNSKSACNLVFFFVTGGHAEPLMTAISTTFGKTMGKPKGRGWVVGIFHISLVKTDL